MYAAIRPLSSSEQLYHRQLKSRVTHRIRIRHRGDVTADMRFSGNGRIYHILSVTDTEMTGVWLDILAEERD